MAVRPPAQRIWWKEPIERVELIWTVLAFLWGVAMFGTMIVWHIALADFSAMIATLPSNHPAAGDDAAAEANGERKPVE